MNSGSKILLHVCCAPCASASVERMRREKWDPVLYYADSNIWPEDEWDKRRLSVEKLSDILSVPLYIEPYAHDDWKDRIKGLEKEPERGLRCLSCFAYNLSVTAEKAQELDIGRFSTTLTISPHKNSIKIFNAGEEFDRFFPIDFKKQAGYRRSVELSREFGLYRQNYCGCEFSIPDKLS